MNKRSEIKLLQKTVAIAASYEQWLERAQELDHIEGNEAWRKDDASDLYHPGLLRKQLQHLKELREAGSGIQLADVLQESLHRHLGEITNPELYVQAHAGTKFLIEDFLDEAVSAIQFLCQNKIEGISVPEKLALFKKAHHNFGRSALMLSGGMAFGIYHTGVAKSLWEQNLLPSVISGSSMGAIVAAGICTRNDDELDRFFAHPEEIHRVAVRLARFPQMLNERVVLSPDQLMEHITANINDMTFAEAYEHTGRVLDITVSPTRSRQKPRVLCHLTAADVLIAHSTLASCAIPGAFAAVTLQSRSGNGELSPYMATEKWIDGSVHGDIPLARLSRLHNVNHSIVSQANPLVLPFITHRRKKGLVPFAKHAVSSFIHAQTAEALKVTRPAWETSFVQPVLDRAFAVAKQTYLGDINIHFPFDPLYYAKVAANPDMDGLKKYIELGERATWPQVAMIKDQTMISRALEQSVSELQKQVQA